MATEKVPREAKLWQVGSRPAGVVPADGFQRFGGLFALLAGASGFLYALSFIVIAQSAPALGGLLSALFLLLGGLFASAALLALYYRLREGESGFALWGVLLGLAGAFGSLAHGGYDLANAINPPGAASNLPSAVDPRGLLVFGVTGVAVFVLSWLIGQDKELPKGLSYLGYLSAVLLVALYLARLIVLQATSPAIVVPAIVEGFVVNPVWYVWLGLALWRRR